MTVDRGSSDTKRGIKKEEMTAKTVLIHPPLRPISSQSMQRRQLVG